MSVNWSLIAAEARSGPQFLAGRLQRLIEDGQLAEGDRLPPERELADTWRVSRATVREALRELELRGLVDRRPGRGTTVTGVAHPSLQDWQLGDMGSAARVIHEVMDLRSAVEPPVAARAAVRGNATDLRHLGNLLSDAERALKHGSLPRLIQLDSEFHVALAKAAHNPLLTQLLETTNSWVELSRDPAYQSEERLVTSLRAHGRILEAVMAQDADAAAQAMSEHLLEVQQAIVNALLVAPTPDGGSADAPRTGPTPARADRAAPAVPTFPRSDERSLP
ncbi:FCD domain-containing protein [Streptomyces sp. SID3343]|uniref:FadR/GntR family transcriptional regulator n=1 Tax=Streptomyces sp. SID3343 TaxID=2690260 RepID=UPI00136A77F1|nr:FCD domain-containing protein [Streptomyces sp. SID3343]MYW05035.1 FCD domain-containing protein [Streptomyces sp. SID3343]